MQTVTIEIINNKALALLKTLELMNLIRLRTSPSKKETHTKKWAKYKGAMSKQSIEDIDNQIQELRNE